MIRQIQALAAGLILFTSVQAQQRYSYYKTIEVGDERGWDYAAADIVNNHLFFSHGSSVLVVSAYKDSIIAEIPNTTGVHGIAFDYELNKGFISNGKSNSVTVFDLKNFRKLDTVAMTGVNPDAILYDPFSKRVFVFNGKTDNATVLDPATLQVLATIPLPGKPEFAVSDSAGSVYVNIEDKNEIVWIDPNRMRVEKEWAIDPGEEPSGLAIDRKNGILFSVCANKRLIVFDLRKERVTESIAIGNKPDAVVYDASTKVIYSSNGEGTVTIIKQKAPDQYETIQVLQTQKGCKTMVLDEQTKKIYLPAAVFEGDTKKIIRNSFHILVYR